MFLILQILYFINLFLVRRGQETGRRTSYVGGQNISELYFTLLIEGIIVYV